MVKQPRQPDPAVLGPDPYGDLSHLRWYSLVAIMTDMLGIMILRLVAVFALCDHYLDVRSPGRLRHYRCSALAAVLLGRLRQATAVVKYCILHAYCIGA